MPRYLIRKNYNGMAYVLEQGVFNEEAAKARAERLQKEANDYFQSRKGHRGVCPTIELFFQIDIEVKPIRVRKKA